MPHITINGRPLCQHTACQAGLDDAKAVDHEDANTCGHVWAKDARKVADAWLAAHPNLDVQVRTLACPHTLDGLTPATAEEN